MPGSALFSWLTSHNGQFPMLYADDAIVVGARLVLVSAPVPEPSAALLGLVGMAGLAAWRRRGCGLGGTEVLAKRTSGR